MNKEREMIWKGIEQQRITKGCLVCGKDVYNYRKNFCSQECKNKWKQEQYITKRNAERIKRHFHKTPLSDEANERGLSYADVQKEQTLKMVEEQLKKMEKENDKSRKH